MVTPPEVMKCIRDVIQDTTTPSWVNSVPRNFGEAAAGTLKADEWHTMATIYLPIALISLWGENTRHATPAIATRLLQVLATHSATNIVLTSPRPM